MVMLQTDRFWLVIICPDAVVAHSYRTASQAHGQALFASQALANGKYTYDNRLYVVEW